MLLSVLRILYGSERRPKGMVVILYILGFAVMIAFFLFILYIVFMIIGIVMGTVYEIDKHRNRRELIHDIIHECNLSNNNYIRITVNIINDEITSDKSKQITGFTIEKERNSIVYYHLKPHGYSCPLEYDSYTTSKSYLEKIRLRIGGVVCPIQVYEPPRGGGDSYLYGVTKGGNRTIGYELISRKEMNRRRIENLRINQQENNLKQL